jgi:hypothetical protein
MPDPVQQTLSKPMTMFRLCFAVAMILAIARCVPVPRNNVYGTYRLNQGGDRYELQILPDGHWRHRVRTAGTVVTDSGTWTWDHDDEGDMITFERFAPRWRREFSPGEVVSAAYWPVEPERTWTGRVRLWVDYDIDLYYIKQ